MTSRYTLAMGAATALSAMLFVGPAIELLPTAACAAPPAKPHVSFSEDVLPLLKFKCGACHLPGGEGAEKSGFEVTSYETVMKGTKFGAMIVPGDRGLEQPDAAARLGRLARHPHAARQEAIVDLRSGPHPHLDLRRREEQLRRPAAPDGRGADAARPISSAWARSGGGGRATSSSAARASSGNARSAAARFSRRWASDEVPGISRMLGARASSQASATCIGVAPRRRATSDKTDDCSGVNPPSGKNGT